jgi:hypothetical protein
MSKAEKLPHRFLSMPKDFTYGELVKLMASFGYQETLPGKTGGSRRVFVNTKINAVLHMHRPHPSGILKHYQLKDAERELKSRGFIK